MTEKHKWNSHVYEYLWVLDASFGDVLRIEIPCGFPENGDYEELIEEAFKDEGEGRRLKDCSWQMSPKAAAINLYTL